MANKTVTDEDRYEFVILADSAGLISGRVIIRASNGSTEAVSIGGAAADVAFSSLGTGAQRTAFAAIIDAARVAARAKLGYA